MLYLVPITYNWPILSRTTPSASLKESAKPKKPCPIGGLVGNGGKYIGIIQGKGFRGLGLVGNKGTYFMGIL